MSLPEVKFTKLFIDNKFVDSVSGATFTTVNPATEEPICKVIESLVNILFCVEGGRGRKSRCGLGSRCGPSCL